MITSEDFPNVKERARKLEPIVNQYAIEDVAMAAFCVSVCINNRSILEATLALNWAVAKHKDLGHKHITTYEEFLIFCQDISEYMQPTSYDDLTVEDYGDVTIEVSGKKYSVILGMGYNMVFACLQFLPYLAQELGKTDVLIEVLEYYSFLIDYLKEINISDGKNGVRYSIPDAGLFYKVKDLFALLQQDKLERIESIVHSDYIEKKHFFNAEGKLFPLANSSMLMDLYDHWYRILSDEQRTRLANRALSGLAASLSKFEKGNNISFLCSAARVDSASHEKVLAEYPFVIVSSKGIILPINQGNYSDGRKLADAIESAIEAKENGELNIIERIIREDKGLRGLTVTKESPVEFMLIDPWANPEERHEFLGERTDKYFRCVALDVVYYLCFMDDVDELYDYVSNKAMGSNTQFFGFGGDASRFLLWKDASHSFEKGAIEVGMVDLGHDTENEYVVDYYKTKINSFPTGGGDYILDNPFAWNVQDKGNGFFQYVLKGKTGFGGLFRRFENDCYFFFPLNASFFNGLTEYTEYKDCISVMDDLFQRMLGEFGSIFENANELNMLPIQIMLMPYSYGKKIDKGGTLFANERSYAHSDSSWLSGRIVIRYVPLADGIFSALQEAKDRSAEVNIFLEVISPLSRYFPDLWGQINEKAVQIRKEKKEISVTAFQIDYKWNREEEREYIVNNDAYISVRKHIAEVCFATGIKPGTYYGKEATSVVRAIQQKLIADFEDEIRKYDYFKLFENALSIYATATHNVIIHRKRYENIGDIKSDVKNEVSKEIIKQREEEKHYARVSSYLLETSLFLREKGKEILTNEKLQYILAYAKWLVVLSDDADKCYFTEKEVRIEVTDEYLIDVEINIGSKEEEIKGLSRRIYDNPGYFDRDYDEDKRFFEIVKGKFKEDTGFELDLLISFLYYLETGGNIGKEISSRNNILCFWKDDILKDFCLTGKQTMSQIRQVLDFISIKPDKLKTKNGQTDFYLPIGEKEKRDNRFEVKPIYEYDDMLIYSPVVLHFLREYWQNSLMEFCMPYEIGLTEIKKTLDDWKRVYEKKIVFDLEEVFKRNDYCTWHNFELRKLDKAKYPQNLGDYDVFAVNTRLKEIWIVECKVLEKVETFYEMYRQQNRFFNEEKFDEKFQRRIDFLKNNCTDIVKDLKLPQSEYVIKPFMCINKVFISRYKEVGFPILSYRELVDMIDNQRRKIEG